MYFASLLIVATITMVSYHTNAQTAETDNQSITLTANLNTTMALTLDASEVIFTFDELDEYKDGIGENDEISLTGDIASTADWKLEYKATSDLEHTVQQNVTIPLNQIGLRAALTGNYNNPSRIVNNAANTPLALQSSDVIIFTKGAQTNAGSSADNEFELFWEMGTQNGNMKNKSLFEENYTRGQYQATIQFTLTEIL